MPIIETRSERRQREREQKKKLKAAIKMVNDVIKLRLGSSKIHGVGVFALRDIGKGEKLYATSIPCMLDIPYKEFNKINPEIRQMILERFPRVIDANSKFMAPDTLMQIYTNHSDNPNYDPKTDKALKKIKSGEEVVEDYKSVENWEQIHPWLK